MRRASSNLVYRRVFDFWFKVFALSFGMVVVLEFQLARQLNWSALAERSGVSAACS